MSQGTDAPGLWFGPEGPQPARERLRKAVTALVRARRLQILLDYAFGGLFAGLCLATVASLAARLTPLPYPTGQITGILIAVALAVALVLGWRQRPDPLEVTIRADLLLRLKQRLSTAWEFMTVHGDDAQTDRLAMQAVKARLPARPDAVFPLRINRWGRLAPLAATGLLVVSLVDLSGVQPRMSRQVDEQVVYEGQRLGAFGREMQSRALRDKLPRSARQAAQLERLGAQMESGTLTRDQALGSLARMGESLDDERTQALAGASPDGRSLPGGASAKRGIGAADLSPSDLLERMQRRALGRDDTRALAEGLEDLERAGIPRKTMESALERYRAGDDEALREILTKLARLERALKEDKELTGALEHVRRAQAALSSPRATPDGDNSSNGMRWDDDEGASGDATGAVGAQAAEEQQDNRSMGRGSLGASHANLGTTTERAQAPLRPGEDPAGRVLRPEARAREGEEFVSQGRMIPRSNRPRVENVEMTTEFAAQTEAVFSREDYPEHTKEFVRRYFLNLSQGARAPSQQAPAREVKRE